MDHTLLWVSKSSHTPNHAFNMGVYGCWWLTWPQVAICVAVVLRHFHSGLVSTGLFWDIASLNRTKQKDHNLSLTIHKKRLYREQDSDRWSLANAENKEMSPVCLPQCSHSQASSLLHRTIVRLSITQARRGPQKIHWISSSTLPQPINPVSLSTYHYSW